MTTLTRGALRADGHRFWAYEKLPNGSIKEHWRSPEAYQRRVEATKEACRKWRKINGNKIMKERPILFNGEMVKAILDGSKTQTRRVVKHIETGGAVLTDPRPYNKPCPFGKPGNQLWVRETWAQNAGDVRAGKAHYKADGTKVKRWTPSIHMPRWASRITLEIVSVWAERLQDISEENAKAEGWVPGKLSPVCWFCDLWESINGPGSWAANPWVWVVEFRRLQP